MPFIAELHRPVWKRVKILMQNLLLVQQKVFLGPCLKIRSYTKSSTFSLSKNKGNFRDPWLIISVNQGFHNSDIQRFLKNYYLRQIPNTCSSMEMPRAWCDHIFCCSRPSSTKQYCQGKPLPFYKLNHSLTPIRFAFAMGFWYFKSAGKLHIQAEESCVHEIYLFKCKTVKSMTCFLSFLFSFCS